MTTIIEQISGVIGSAPADLVTYYERGDFPLYPVSRINCLSFEGARLYSFRMNRMSVVERLGLWILDDAHDSNPFAYISKGPCAGMIIHFSHDLEPMIAFSSLESFLTKIHKAGAECRVRLDFLPSVLPTHSTTPAAKASMKFEV